MEAAKGGRCHLVSMAALSGGAGAGMSGAGRQGNVRSFVPVEATGQRCLTLCVAVLADQYTLDDTTGAASAGGQPCTLRQVSGAIERLQRHFPCVTRA